MISLHEILRYSRLILYVEALRNYNIEEAEIRKAVEEIIRLTRTTLSSSGVDFIDDTSPNRFL